MVASELSLLGVALIGSLAYGGGDFIGGRASLRLSPVGVIVLAQFAALAIAAQAVPWPGRSALTGPVLVPGLSGGVFYALALWALYRGIAEGRAALVTPVFAIVSILVPLGADLVLGHPLTQPQAGGLLVCAAAIVFLAQVRERETGHGPHFSFRLGLVGGMADGIADVCLGAQPPSAAFDALLVARALMAMLALAILLWLVARPRTLPEPRTARPALANLVLAGCLAIGAGVCDALGHISYVELATRGSISVASALVGVLSAAVVVLLAVALLRERLAPTQLAGLALGALGIAALSG